MSRMHQRLFRKPGLCLVPRAGGVRRRPVKQPAEQGLRQRASEPDGDGRLRLQIPAVCRARRGRQLHRGCDRALRPRLCLRLWGRHRGGLQRHQFERRDRREPHTQPLLADETITRTAAHTTIPAAAAAAAAGASGSTIAVALFRRVHWGPWVRQRWLL